MKHILVTLDMDEQHRSFLEEQAKDCAEDYFLVYKNIDEVTAEDVAAADAILGNCHRKALKGATEKLAWMQLPSAGANLYVGPGILPENTVLTNSSGAYGLTVSEHMVALTFACMRRLGEYARKQHDHIWEAKGEVFAVEGSTVLVLGVGDIGGRYARKMQALGAYTIGIRRTAKEKPEWLDEQYTFEKLDEVLPRADIVAMVLPGSAETEHIMDERRLRLMKPTAVIVNDGRGSAIDPEALKKVMKEGHLFAAGLDVTEPEPLPADDELWDMPNVIVTPHSGGQFLMKDTYEKVVKIFADNLRRFLDGEELKHIVDKKAGY